MWAKQKHQSGFTTVELLIVILVIGILACITIVSYNDMQLRNKNAKTVQALNLWIKALDLYKEANGTWPSGFACLGTGYKYNLSGTDPSGQGQCRQSGHEWGVEESSSFNAAMEPYVSIKPLPTPAFVTTRSSDTEWLRGISYVSGGGIGDLVYVQAVYAGTLGSCPSVHGVTATSNTWDNNTNCRYQLGTATNAS